MQIFCISWSLQQGLYPMTWHILGHRAGQGRAGLSQDRAQSGLVIYVRSAICPTSPTFQNITNKKLIKEFVRVSKDQLRRWVFVRWVNLVCSKIQSPNSNIFFKPSSSAKDVKNKREKEVVFVWIIIHRQGSSWWETREQMTERERWSESRTASVSVTHWHQLVDAWLNTNHVLQTWHQVDVMGGVLWGLKLRVRPRDWVWDQRAVSMCQQHEAERVSIYLGSSYGSQIRSKRFV